MTPPACPRCGSELDKDERFCWMCTLDSDKEYIQCERCGNDLDNDDNCLSCGLVN
jgi:predicted amidophosphoribosyltransferase